MNYGTKVWLSKQWWFKVVCWLSWRIKPWLLPECGHIDTCGKSFRLDCVRIDSIGIGADMICCPKDCVITGIDSCIYR